MRARNKVIRGLLAGAVVAAAVTGFALTRSDAEADTGGAGGGSGAAAPAVDATTTARTATVPLEVSGKLPIYPKALWKYGATGPQVRELEARLIQLKLIDKQYLDNEYGTMTRSAVKKFQASKGIPRLGYVDQYTWTTLTAATRKPTRDELYPPVPVMNGKKLDPRCATGRVLCIDKTSRKLRYVVDGVVKMQLDVRFGAKATATREGGFTVGWKSRHHHSRLYDSPMPYAMFFSGGQAVHYSSDFAARGYNGASHGCANVRDLGKIRIIFDQIKVGDKVIIYRS